MIHGQCPHHDSWHIKTNKKNWERKIHDHGKPPVPSITPLFNLLALRNKLNPKSVLMVYVSFSPQFVLILNNIYLFTFVFEMILVLVCNLFSKRGNAIYEIE